MTSNMPITRAELADRIDHTLLRPEATREDVATHVAEATELGVRTVCISPSMLPVRAGSMPVGTVIGFPSGKHHSLIKAMEARIAVDMGATELDMVLDYSAIISGRPEEILGELSPVRDAAPHPVVLKVILETAAIYAAFGDERVAEADAAIANACELAAKGGANVVKTSTGFHPAGGASAHAVRVMAQAVDPLGSVLVKASGGISTAAQAVEMLEAGATLIGTSRSAKMLAELG